MRRHIKFILRLTMLVFILTISTDILLSQESTEHVVNDAKREEVQRYFGYEVLLYRYLSVPYDISLNVNEHGSYVEIGFMFLFFIPVLLLFLFRNKKIPFFMTLIITVVLWIISTSNSFIYSDVKGKIATNPTSINTYLVSPEASQEQNATLLSAITKTSNSLYKPLESIGNGISGNSDYITYPVIFLLFLIVSFLLESRTRTISNRYRMLLGLLWTYAFFWFAFTGGIIWYGYILILLAYFFINILIRKLISEDPKWGRVLNYSFMVMGCFWILLGLVSRVSNIQIVAQTTELGKGVFNQVFYEYGLGKISADEAINKVYPNSIGAINTINQEENSMIWRVGTSFTYFIKNSQNRVKADNQLGTFYELFKRYPQKSDLTDLLKANNFKYIIVDLATAQIDRTPQKTLTEKYRQLMIFIYNNPQIQLLGTDRILQRQAQAGNIEYFYGDFGEVYYNGSFAIYQIL